MVDSHNMTHSEHFRLNGTLSERRCLELIAVDEKAAKFLDAVTYIKEGSSCFPGEDFLDSVITKLESLTRDKKVSTKPDYVWAVEWCLSKLDDIRSATRHESEHGASELRNAMVTLEVAA